MSARISGSGSASDKVDEMFVGNDSSKSKPYLFMPPAFLSDEIEENEVEIEALCSS